MATEAHNDEIVVAVVGVTGCGKSSFIKRVTGNESIEIGHDLRSKTAEVQAYPLQITGKCYTLVDTPGFDDGERTDEDIFASLADWLRRSYDKGQRLNALLYLHGIIANREKGSDLRNLKVFKKLCGAENYGRIVLGITWWDQVDPQTALARETMLAETPEFWGDMVQKGSRIERIPHDKAQCMQLLYSLVQNQRTTLRIQHEMAEGKEALRTTAAMEMEQYKAIDAIKDAEEGERRAQEIVYQLKNKAIEQWASERRLEQHRRHQELQMQQMSQIADLETIRARMIESEPSRRSPRPEASDRTRRIEELAAALQQARLRTQPPSYTADNRLERMSIMARINMHVDKIRAADQQLNELVGNAKQGWYSILDPTKEGDYPLWKAFCDRCLRQASVKGYWRCAECMHNRTEIVEGKEETVEVWMLICNQCKERGQTCLNRSHTLEQCVPGARNPNQAFEDIIEFCPRTRYISAGTRCNKCQKPPGTVFFHCCECEKDDFDLCLECFIAGKTCKKKKKHTLFLHSWCPPAEWRQISAVVDMV